MEFEGKCHFCGGDIIITETTCTQCNTVTRGHFEVCDLCKLPSEAKQFIKVFIECDGNIKNVEKALGISYPTVKSRLALVQAELKELEELRKNDNYENKAIPKKIKRKTILKEIETGNITVEEALKHLE